MVNATGRHDVVHHVVLACDGVKDAGHLARLLVLAHLGEAEVGGAGRVFGRWVVAKRIVVHARRSVGEEGKNQANVNRRTNTNRWKQTAPGWPRLTEISRRPVLAVTAAA